MGRVAILISFFLEFACRYRCIIRLISVFFLLICASSHVSIADDLSPNPEKELKLVRIKIAQSQNEISKLRKSYEEAQKNLSEKEIELQKLKKEEVSGVDSLMKLGSKIDSLTLQMQDVSEQIEDQKDSFKDRMSSIYKTRRKLSPLSFLFLSSGVHSFYRRADYLRRLVENDSNQIKEFELLLSTLKLTSDELFRLKEEETTVLDKVKNLKIEVTKKQLEEARLSRDVSIKLEKTKESLEIYRAQEQEFERILQGLTGGGDQTLVETDFSPTPLPSFSSRSLPFPVEGTIVQHFGKQKHDEFSETIFAKGIEIAAAPDSDVRSVSDGKIVFSSELPGFGNVIIIEHPGKFFTLYGRIIPSKNSGDTVKSNEVLGKTSEPDQRGRNFYFEIRQEGKPMNPQLYLAKGSSN